MELEDVAVKTKEELFARNIRVLRLELTAWCVYHQGAEDSSVTLMTQAVGVETSTPKAAVTPAATLPAYELLGDLLFEQGKPSEAFTAYKRSQELSPGRFNSLYMRDTPPGPAARDPHDRTDGKSDGQSRGVIERPSK